MILVALSGKEKRQHLGAKDYVCVGIQVPLGLVNCIFLTASPQYGHTHSQIKSFLWGEVCDLEEVKRRGEHTQRGRKQRPSFSKTVTQADWERVSQEL